MALGTQDKEPRGFYSQANADLSAPLNTRPSQTSRQTTHVMDQQLRGMAPPMGMPKVAAPSAPAAAGPITQMSQAAAANYASSPNQVPTIPSMMPRAAQQPPAALRTYAEPEIPTDVLQRFAQLQSPNMGIQPQGRDYGSPLPTQQPAQAPANPLVGMRVSDTSVPSIKRVDGGSSPLFTNIDPAQAVEQMRGGTLNTLPAATFRGSVSEVAAQEPSGPRFASIGGGSDLASMLQKIESQYDANRAARQRSLPTGHVLARDHDKAPFLTAAMNALRDQAGLSQSASQFADQQALDQQRLGLDQQRLALDAPGAQGQQLQNQQTQMMMDLTRKAIGGDQEALKQLQALQGKSPKTPQSEALLEILKAYTQGQATALPGSGVPINQVLQDVGPLLQMLGGQAPAAAPVAPPADGTRGTLNGVRGVVRNGQFIPD